MAIIKLLANINFLLVISVQVCVSCLIPAMFVWHPSLQVTDFCPGYGLLLRYPQCFWVYNILGNMGGE